jgi:hypothetical protein
MNPTILHAFTLRMASHGFPVSRTMMVQDGGYALDQLRCAHTLADDVLRRLAMELFRQFERTLSQPTGASLVRAPALLQ